MQQGHEIPRYTIDDYQHWKDDWELIGGYPYATTPSPFFRHQKTGLKIGKLLSIALDACKSCSCDVVYELDWIISIDTIVRPDLMIVCDQINEDDFVRTTPAMVIEIMSQKTKLKDRNVKFNLYEKCGVKYYLLVDTETERIQYFELEQGTFQPKPSIATFVLNNTSTKEADLSAVFR